MNMSNKEIVLMILKGIMLCCLSVLSVIIILKTGYTLSSSWIGKAIATVMTSSCYYFLTNWLAKEVDKY